MLDPRSWVEFPFTGIVPPSENSNVAVQNLMQRPVGPAKTPKLKTVLDRVAIPAALPGSPGFHSVSFVIDEDFDGFFQWNISGEISLVSMGFSVTGSSFVCEPMPLNNFHSHKTGFDVGNMEYSYYKESVLTAQFVNRGSVPKTISAYLFVQQVRR